MSLWKNKTCDLTELRIPFHQVKEAPIYANVEIQDNIFIFASKHSSAAGVPSLSVHFPGNWNTANLGGKQKTLCKAAPLEMKEAFLELHKSSPEGLQVTLEVTHHGPVCNTPCFFIEIGSSLEQWKDKALGKIIAKTLKEILNKKPKQYEIALGIGGPHYCNNFNRIELQSNIAFSHICPKHNLEFLDKEMLLQASMSKPRPLPAVRRSMPLPLPFWVFQQSIPHHWVYFSTGILSRI